MNEIQPMGMTESDLAVIQAATAAAAGREDGVLRYWSQDRLILWLGLHIAGKLASWVMVPCATKEDAERQSRFWAEVVAAGLQEGAAAAAELAAGAMRRAADSGNSVH